MLLQLDEPTSGRTKEGGLEVSIQASGEDPQYNLPLAEKLHEFGLQLPTLDDDDTPESYMQKVQTRTRYFVDTSFSREHQSPGSG